MRTFCNPPAGGVRVDIRNLSALHSLLASRLDGLVRFVLRHEKIRRAELSVCFVSEERIRRLNKKFLLKDSTTDVLAFDISAKGLLRHGLLGDVVVCVDVARRVSKRLGIPFEEELRRYLIHGMLHLAGYDDSDIRRRRRMWKRQEELMKKTACSNLAPR